jgi:hypothetical protein
MGQRTASTRRLWIDAERRVHRHSPGPLALSLRPRRKPRHGPNTRQVTAPTQSTLTLAPPVIDNFAEPLPVGAHELEVVETYLGALLKDLLGPQV